MLEVKIDLVPFGMERLRRTIGIIELVNDGTGDTDTGNYKYTIKDKTGSIKGEYKGFKRIKQNAFHLLRDILNKSLME